MTAMELTVAELKSQLPHLKEVTDEGWVFLWGQADEPVFELLCPGATLAAMKDMDQALSKAYELAKHTLN